jgi:hypothetical protein
LDGDPVSDPDDALFRNLEREMNGDRAITIMTELREWFNKYMTDLGPKVAKERYDAVLQEQPDADQAAAAMVAQQYAVADGVMSAVAIHLARDKP